MDRNYSKLWCFIDWIMELDNKFGMKCSKCGYDRCFSALDFHHFSREDKDFNLGHRLRQKPTEELLKELDKGTLLCARCHREVHCGCQDRIPQTLTVTRLTITPKRNWWSCISRKVKRLEMRLS